MSTVRKLIGKRQVRIVIICFLALLAALSVTAGAKNALEFSQDFQWDAAKALAMGLDPYELSLAPEKAPEYPELSGFYRMFTDRGLSQKMEANQFPSLLVLLWPMTLFLPQTAKVVWLVLNLLFTGGIIFLLKKTFFEKAGAFESAAISLLMLSGTPYRNQIGVGQHTLFAFFFFMLAVYFEKDGVIKNKRIQTAAVSFGLFVSYFKYTLTAPLALYFLYRKRYRELVFSLLGHVVITIICALRLDKSVIYLLTAPLKVASALTSEGGIDLGVILGKGSFAAFVVIFALLALMAAFFPKRREDALFSVLILWSLVMAYHRTYDFFVLAAVSALFFEDGSMISEEHTDDVFFKKRTKTALFVWYLIVVAVIFFGLRLFHENTPSMIAAGILYYLFTAAVTFFCIKTIKTTGKR